MSNKGINKSCTLDKDTFTLTPLNIRDLTKQLLEHKQAELEDISESDDEEDEQIETQASQEMNMELETQSLQTLKEEFPKKNDDVTDSFNESKVAVEENILDVTILCDNKENILGSTEPLNLSKHRKKNDSFDLDFSALSISTPVKKKDSSFNFTTPKINIIPSSETKSLKTTDQQLFLTPQVNQSSVTRPLFKTPVNKHLNIVQYSAKKPQSTPFQSVKKQNNQNNGLSGVYDNPRNCIPPVIYEQEDYNKLTVNNNEYLIMNLLGKGGSSEVFHCFHPEEKVHVAIKVVNLSNSTTADVYINEVKLLESLQKCDRIIKMHDYEIQNDKLIVVLEKGGEDLSAILKQLAKKQTRLPNYMLLFYWMEMLYAVKQIHMNGVIHSDLKPANFICAEHGLKLIDFGIASKVQEDMTCVYKMNQEGSCNYISPEALNVQTYENSNSPSCGKPKYKIHFKSDVWSLGCILYQLVYCRTPFQHLNQLLTKLVAICNPNFEIHYPPANWVSPKIIKTIKSCLQHDIKSRPSIDDLINEYEDMLKNL
ncbi:dual specificity protein kinase monopolar spindle 1 [Rhynchophorus ferrugineus]|uniref:dual specificity protein kinase monopolar spindle 1 n=1 Tax=Rhynchophorus ferrugineus TaxID=354439 RepID=UPI003FCE093A